MSTADFYGLRDRARFASPAATSTSASRTAPQAVVAPAVWWTMLACSAVAMFSSGYLAWASLTSSPVAGCGGGSVFDCSHVLHSRWSTVLGVPVSVAAVALHASVLTLLMLRPTTPAAEQRRWRMIGFAAIAAGGAALWFIGLQIFALAHYCPYCLVAHVAGLTLAAAFLWSRPVSRSWLAGASASGLLSVAGLIGLQTMNVAPQTFEVIEHAPSKAAGVPAAGGTEAATEELELFAPPAGADLQTSVPTLPSQFDWLAQLTPQLVAAIVQPTTLLSAQVGTTPPAAPAAPERKMVQILNGTQLATSDWPLIGNPDAEIVFVEMFDYTCPHCQRTHQAIEGARAKYGDRMAVIMLPVPLDGKCNPATTSSNANACELAKLAIALWRVDRNQFEHFHDYVMESKPSYQQALAHAGTMVDPTQLQSMLAHSLPSDYIKRHVALYQRCGGGSIPKLLFPKTTVVGAVEGTDSLVRLIEQHVTR